MLTAAFAGGHLVFPRTVCAFSPPSRKLDRVDWRAWLPTVIDGSRGRGAYGPEGISIVPSHGTRTDAWCSIITPCAITPIVTSVTPLSHTSLTTTAQNGVLVFSPFGRSLARRHGQRRDSIDPQHEGPVCSAPKGKWAHRFGPTVLGPPVF